MLMMDGFPSFVVSLTVPYLIDDKYAGLQSKVGYIYGSLAAISLIFAFLCVPETKGESLETIGRMFMDRVPVRQFKEVRHQYIATERVAITKGDEKEEAEMEVVKTSQA